MKYVLTLLLIISCLCNIKLDADLKKFTNYSDLIFNDYFENGLPYREMIDEGQTVPLTDKDCILSTTDGTFKIHFNESGFTFTTPPLILDGQVWIETDFPYLGHTKLFFIFYYTHSVWTQIGIVINEDRTVTFEPLLGIQQVIYPATTAPRPIRRPAWQSSY